MRKAVNAVGHESIELLLLGYAGGFRMAVLVTPDAGIVQRARLCMNVGSLSQIDSVLA